MKEKLDEIDNRPVLSASWLVEQGILSSDSYRQMIVRKTLIQARRACKGQPAMVFFDNMPLHLKQKVFEKMDVYKEFQKCLLDVQHNAEASRWYNAYMTEDGKMLPEEKIAEYYATACVLDAITKFINDRNAKRSAMGGKAGKCWELIAENLLKVDEQFRFALPDNVRSLERKWKKYRDEGYVSLIHKHFICGKNAAKVEEGDQSSALIELLSIPNNWDDAKVAKHYNSMAEVKGWKKITARTVQTWRERYHTEIFATRHGVKEFKNRKTMQVKRTKPTAPLYFWSLDGWDAELLYQSEDDRGTRYHNRLTLEVVLDACCDYPIGYAIGEAENANLIKEALRNAAQHTAELFGTMYRPTQIQSDHYAMKAMTPIYEGMAEYVTPAEVGNAKAKPVERYFKHLNTTYCQELPNWSGFGVTAKKELQPNAELLNKRKKAFPTKDECIAQLVEIIERERALKREEMLIKWAKNERKVEMSHRDYLQLFGEETQTRATLTGNGLKISIGGVKRDFECFDIQMRKHMSERWSVMYDPNDLSHVVAVSEDRRLMFEMETKAEMPMAIADRKPGDYEKMKRVREFNAELTESVADAISEKQGTCMRLLNEAAAIEQHEDRKTYDTLSKFLLTDNNGQHKDRKSESRLSKRKDIEDAVFSHSSDEDDELNVWKDY